MRDLVTFRETAEHHLLQGACGISAAESKYPLTRGESVGPGQRVYPQALGP
jgi:hypothetical protein